MGLARSGVAAALALQARGEEVLGVDAGTPVGIDVLSQAGLQTHVGTEGLAQLGRARTVVKSPGVPAQAPVIATARERGVDVLGELELAWRMLRNEFIAVTGTNGKTTTVELIGHIHREAGLPVAVAGNVGVALSGLVGKVEEDATIVCEASSFQLEDTLAFAPEAAVLLNLAPDHLDRHGTLETYLAAKLEAFARQGNDDLAVAPTAALLERDAGLEVEDLGGCGRRVCFGDGPEADLSLRSGQLWWQERPLLAVAELSLRGAHNVENAMAAAAVCLARGVDPDAVRAGLRSFAGVAHRLERVAVRDGVLFVNDSKATNVASTRVALAAFAVGRRAEPEARRAGDVLEPDRGRTVHLILGGQGKDQDFSALRDHVERSCRAVYLIGQDAPAIAHALAGGRASVHACGDLERAVRMAGATAVAGEVVLLSPACASFDQFADFEARGERFRELVMEMER
ncbi:MAG TPA: UDP-N-acetylmuramoyl-L-alanine--D-glutamate ligase [Solirubrobacteraceae bacterium]